LFKLLVILAIAGAVSGAAGGALLAKALRVDNAAAEVGEVGIAVGTTNSLTVDGVGLAAGDHMQRALDLTNTGTARIRTVTLTTTGSPSSALDTDPVNGLQLRIDLCSEAWHESGPPYVYSCMGQIRRVLARRPVIGTNIALAKIKRLKRPGQSAHLRLTLMLPATAPSELQNQSSGLTYSFVAA
jgi:hypothetical protein